MASTCSCGSTTDAPCTLTCGWTARSASGPWRRSWRGARRVELWLQDGRLTAVDVPVLGIVPTAVEDRIVGHLGPTCAARDQPDLAEVLDRLAEGPAEPLAGALLDQRNVAGFGNVYAVELPFIVGVSPNQPVGTDRRPRRPARLRCRA